jgi:hypothetical protein
MGLLEAGGMTPTPARRLLTQARLTGDDQGLAVQLLRRALERGVLAQPLPAVPG